MIVPVYFEILVWFARIMILILVLWWIIKNSIKLSKCQIEIWKDFFCSRQLKNKHYCKRCGLSGREFLRFTTSKMAAPIIKVITGYGIFA